MNFHRGCVRTLRTLYGYATAIRYMTPKQVTARNRQMKRETETKTETERDRDREREAERETEREIERGRECVCAWKRFR